MRRGSEDTYCFLDRFLRVPGLGVCSLLTLLLSGRGFFRPTIPVRASKLSGCLLGGYYRLRSMTLFQETFGSSVLLAQKHVMATVQTSMNMALLALERSSARGCIHNYEGMCQLSRLVP